jgi:hypothetical protein
MMKYILLYGTRDEVDHALRLLPKRTSDRTLWDRPIFEHMQKHLGVAIYEVGLSMRTITPACVTALILSSTHTGKLLFRVVEKDLSTVVVAYGSDLTNYVDGDPDYPGPFGALCRVYGKPFWR